MSWTTVQIELAQPSLTDADVIHASLSDPRGFGAIFERHHDAVFRFVARRVSVTEASDVCSEVFERAFRIRKRYDVAYPNCLPWLHGIARNIVGDTTRFARRHERLALAPEPAIRFESDSENRVMARDAAVRLLQVWRQTPRADREALFLYAVDGLTYQEVGRVLGVPPGTVASRISRARTFITEAIPELGRMTDRAVKAKGGSR